MTDPRELLERQREAMAAELQTAEEEYATLEHLTEYGARWGTALRELLTSCDIADEGGDPYRLTMSAAFVRATIKRALAGEASNG